ncbi:hypothetical protein KC19_4G023400 [Ceratodon purpureus]|uniref:Uncharacterized protein n=1 Tax=Ceratodon purpureus TaxID=3225 RepID=A0A8T0I5Q1_CERPU|nr:hypothetical protein KC19_4G023400 [Ceratodon purpureus]
MVQESRSLLIQQLLQGGFKEEDDDDEDEDESHELTKRHPRLFQISRANFLWIDKIYWRVNH